MRYYSLILVSLASLLLVSHRPPSMDEIIRRKVENIGQQQSIYGEAISCEQSVPRFYEKRAFEAAWDPSASEQLMKMISKASDEGLDPEDYHAVELGDLTERYQDLNDVQRADLDILATDAYLLYVSHLISGKTNPETLDPEWHVIRREGDPLALLEMAIESGDVETSIRSVLPKHNIYKGLRNALATYREIEDRGGWEEIQGKDALKPGVTGTRVAEVRERLRMTGDLEEDGSDDPEYYGKDLEAAVRHFQERHGLDADGVVGKQTLEAMNVPVEKRIEQIRVNMERWRWLPQEYSNYYIKVNIADFTMEIVKDGEIKMRRNIIVGKKYRRTPVFNARMTYLVLNPTWTVPPGILKADIIPAARKDPDYLKNKNIKVYGPQSRTIDPDSIDWTSNKTMSYTFVQDPGPSNALGAVKFMFPNPYHVYLHDTPSKELFKKAERTFSSGCIRVSEPLEVAELLLSGQQGWNRESIRKTLDSGKTVTVSLAERPDVYILYWTAWTSDNGIVNFRNDIYERDGPVAETLRSHYSDFR